jgi:hypothetical protein
MSFFFADAGVLNNLRDLLSELFKIAVELLRVVKKEFEFEFSKFLDVPNSLIGRLRSLLHCCHHEQSAPRLQDLLHYLSISGKEIDQF